MMHEALLGTDVERKFIVVQCRNGCILLSSFEPLIPGTAQ